MDKKQKENIKQVVGEGLMLIMSKLKISRPSAKIEQALKKHSKKLTVHFKAEVKRAGKGETKNVSKKSSSIAKKAKVAGTTKPKSVSK